jgi:hypothetical protein
MRALQGRAKSCKWRNLAALRNRAICDDEPELCTCGQSSRSHLGHIAPDFFCQRSINGRGEPGPGKWVTIYANAGHACIKVAGIYLDTAAGLGNPPNPPPPARAGATSELGGELPGVITATGGPPALAGCRSSRRMRQLPRLWLLGRRSGSRASGRRTRMRST